MTDTVRSSPAAGLTQGKTGREKATEGHLQECGERRCRLGLQSRDAGGGRGSDPGCTLKVEPTRFARDLMWREKERKREAWRTTATFPGTTACASPTGNASSSRRGQCLSALATLHKVRPTDACRESHEASPNSFSVPSFCLQGKAFGEETGHPVPAAPSAFTDILILLRLVCTPKKQWI